MKVLNLISFGIGAAIGSAVSILLVKKKYQMDADEQINAVKEKMSELQKDNEVLRDVRKKTVENYNKSFDDITKSSEENNEVDYSSISKKNKPVSTTNDEITQVDEHKYFDYINNKNFSERAFTFYQGDGSLVDEDNGLLIPNPEKYVGHNGVDAMCNLSVEETYYVDEENEVVNCIAISEDSYYDSEPEGDE